MPLLVRLSILLSLLALAVACSNNTESGEEEPTSPFPEIHALNKQIEAKPNDATLHFARAGTHQGLGQYKEAIADYQRAIELSPNSAEYHVAMSDLYLLEYAPRLNLPDSKRAIDLLEGYLQRHPDNQLVLHELAESYIYIEMYRQALERLRTAIEYQAFNPEAFFKVGISYKYLGDTASAIKAFQRSVEQEPGLYDAHMQLGLLMSAQQNDQALTYFNNALVINPESVEALYGKARYLQDLKRSEEAKAAYRELVLLAPSHHESHYNLGTIFLQQDSLDRAYRSFDIAISVNPTFVAAYFARGTVSELRGDKDAAAKDYNTCLNLDPDYQPALDALNEL